MKRATTRDAFLRRGREGRVSEKRKNTHKNDTDRRRADAILPAARNVHSIPHSGRAIDKRRDTTTLTATDKRKRKRSM